MLIGGDWIDDARLVIDGSAIAALSDAAPSQQNWNAEGLLVLPGIVDLHGDAFERQIMPRPGVHFALDVALADTDRQLVANGITTAFHAVTWSWEPGLRGRDMALEFADALKRLRPRLAADARLHLRWETFNLEAEAQILAWLQAGRIDLLAFNDHTPEIIRKIRTPKNALRYTERTGLDADEFCVLANTVWTRQADVPAAIARLAAAAQSHNVPLASHDDETPEMRNHFHGLGCAIAEFPKTMETAVTARTLGDAVVMGAPNVVRGGSHLNSVGAAQLVGAGLCSVLSSDYYYPALLRAAFRLAQDKIVPLADAWALVSTNPAAAGGLSDRGRLTPGQRADFILVDDQAPDGPRVVATFVAGKPVYLDRDMRQRAA